MTLRYARINNMLAAAHLQREVYTEGRFYGELRGRATPVKRSQTNSVSTDGESGLHGVRLTFTQLHSQLYELSCKHTTHERTNEQRDKEILRGDSDLPVETHMRLACTSAMASASDHIARRRLRELVLHQLNHQPSETAQVPPPFWSLSLSLVENLIPLLDQAGEYG